MKTSLGLLTAAKRQNSKGLTQKDQFKNEGIKMRTTFQTLVASVAIALASTTYAPHAIAGDSTTISASNSGTATKSDEGAKTSDAGRSDKHARHKEFFAALHACASANGIEVGPGKGRPTEEQRAVIDACLKEKRIAPPEHRRGEGPGGHHHGPPPSAPEGEN